MSTSNQSAFTSHTEWYKTFLQHTNQKQVSRNTIIGGLKEKVPEIWQRIQNPNYSFVTLFVGAGNGGAEIPLLQKFISVRGSRKKFAVFCEDPSQTLREEFYKKVKDIHIDSIIKEYNSLPFEDPTYHPPDADFSLASHCWYFIKSWENVEREKNSLAKFARSVAKKNGVGLIVLHSKLSDRHVVPPRYLTLNPKAKEAVGEELEHELRRLGIPFRSDLVTADVDISLCFQNVTFNPNPEGENLLSFFLRESWSQQSKETKEEIGKKLSELVRKNEKQLIIIRELYIWIQGHK